MKIYCIVFETYKGEDIDTMIKFVSASSREKALEAFNNSCKRRCYYASVSKVVEVMNGISFSMDYLF